jgi:hypothetical protein
MSNSPDNSPETSSPASLNNPTGCERSVSIDFSEVAKRMLERSYSPEFLQKFFKVMSIHFKGRKNVNLDAELPEIRQTLIHQLGEDIANWTDKKLSFTIGLAVFILAANDKNELLAVKEKVSNN